MAGGTMMRLAALLGAAWSIPIRGYHALMGPEHDFTGIHRNLLRLYPGYERRPRGKGAPSKPKRRPNRLTISKRVRRKHRRAAA